MNMIRLFSFFLFITCLSTQAEEEKKHTIDIWLSKKLKTDLNTSAMILALHEAGQKWDKQMNTSYSYLISNLKPDQKEKLKIAQKAWIVYRDAEAKAQGTILTQPLLGSSSRLDSADAYYQLIKTRALILDQYENVVRELKADLIPPENKGANASENNNYAIKIGNTLSDAKWSVYQGSLGAQKGILSLQWLPKKEVRGFFYPEGVMTEYRFYGYNFADGKLRLEIYKDKQKVGSGVLSKIKTNGKLNWAGAITLSGNTSQTSFKKLNDTSTKVKSTTSYRLLKGLKGKTLEMTWHKNDSFSAYIEGNLENEVFFSGINYRKGWMFMHESGHFGDNESLVGARLLLRKQTVNGALVWQGYRYHHNGDVTLVAFGRKTK